MNECINIRKMTASDIDVVYSLHLSDSDNDPNRYVIDWLNETVDDPCGYLFVAFWGDELAGYCGMYHNTSTSNPEIQTSDYCKIGNIVVKSCYRRRGIGKSLMLKMLDTAKKFGVGKVKLEVDTKSEAVELYKSLGFQIKETEKSFYDDGDDAYIIWHYFE